MSDGYPDALLDDLMVSGSEEKVVAGLQRVLAAAFAAVARAAHS